MPPIEAFRAVAALREISLRDVSRSHPRELSCAIETDVDAARPSSRIDGAGGNTPLAIQPERYGL